MTAAARLPSRAGPDAPRIAGARVVRLETGTPGIAAALNRGIRTALDAGADAVVTFDQDSRIGGGVRRGLLAARAAAAAEGLRVGPVVPEQFAAVSQVHGATAGGTLLARHVIQSGMLLDRRDDPRRRRHAASRSSSTSSTPSTNCAASTMVVVVDRRTPDESRAQPRRSLPAAGCAAASRC